MDDEAWINVPKKGAREIRIAASKRENGKWVYQVKTKDGSLYKDGTWVTQDRLEAC